MGRNTFLRIVLTALAVFAGTGLHAARTSKVAVIIDRDSYAVARDAVRSWGDALRRQDGKESIVWVIGPEVTPQIIRDSLSALHVQQGLEGALLAGKVPVAMVRRAHHLATAFKMNPKWNWQRSSVPSDRFYDDFNLAFTLLKQDEKRPDLWYFDLSPEGAQQVRCDIYTARVKPAGNDPALIRAFFERAAAAKAMPEALDRAWHFGGHGNSSESINARIDEDRAFYEQFDFDSARERVFFTNFDEDRFIRARLMEILSDGSLDFAHLHHHGGVGAQYLSKTPYTYMASEYIENTKSFLRGKMRDRRNKDKAQTRVQLRETYGVPDSWLDGWDDPRVTCADSARSAAVDLYLEDLEGFKSGPKVLLLDACFNGAFIHDDYIAARYAFGEGSSTMLVCANSVNIIQDHWKNELAGVLRYGVCTGNWAKQNLTLEAHLFGDPTWHFAAPKDSPKGLDAIAASQDGKQARKFLRSGKTDLRGWAVKFAPLDEEQLLAILRDDPAMNVRMEAMMRIVRTTRRMEVLVEALRTALDDSYELVRRMGSRYVEVCCDPSLGEAVARHYLSPLEGKRIFYHLSSALTSIPHATMSQALRKVSGENGKGYFPNAEGLDKVLTRLEKAEQDKIAEWNAVFDSSVSIKEKTFSVSAMRNACDPYAIDPMLRLIAEGPGTRNAEIQPAADGKAAEEILDLRCKAAEALGWYVWSYRRSDILSSCRRLLEQVREEPLKDELRRTVARLAAYAD